MGLDTTWRIIVALGALPAMLTYYIRSRLPETPRFTLQVQPSYITHAVLHALLHLCIVLHIVLHSVSNETVPCTLPYAVRFTPCSVARFIVSFIAACMQVERNERQADNDVQQVMADEEEHEGFDPDGSSTYSGISSRSTTVQSDRISVRGFADFLRRWVDFRVRMGMWVRVCETSG